ncbi:unnamed protein product [Rotaria sp. Silwood1]|nr:unnamed protein product [Rotaria sp. Silwood1]
MSHDNNENKTFHSNLISTADIIDEPLFVVLDDDDDDDWDEDDKCEIVNLATIASTTTTTILSETNSNNTLLDENKEKKISTEVSFDKDSGEQLHIETQGFIDSLVSESKSTPKIFRHSKISNKSAKSNRSIRNMTIDTNFMRQKPHQQQRTKSVSKRKKMSTSNASDNHKDFSIDDHPIDCILSHISFESSIILTISRMGSIYYCVEDLYLKVFASLCTFDEFIYLLEGIDRNILKTVTLSEKISIEQQNSLLKTFNGTRYHLLSINSFDYLTKIKQLLNKYEKSIENIINEMFPNKQTSTSIPLNNKVSPSSISTERMETNNNDKQCQNLITSSKTEQLNEPCQFGNIITYNSSDNCNRTSTNETSSISISNIDSNIISKPTLMEQDNNNDNKLQSEQNSNNNLIERSRKKSGKYLSSSSPNTSLKRRILNSFNTPTNHSSISKDSFTILPTTNLLRRIHRSKSFTPNKHQIKRFCSRSCSLPSIENHIEDNIMLKPLITIKKSNDLIDDYYKMPSIVNVEENVQINNQNITIYEKPLAISQQSSINNTISPVLKKKSTQSVYPQSIQSTPYHLTPIPYDAHHQKSYPSPSPLSDAKSKELLSHHRPIQPKLISSSNNNPSQTNFNSSSSAILQFLQKRIKKNNNIVNNNNNNVLIPEKQTVPIPCCSPCCYGQLPNNGKPCISKNSSSNERMILPKYTVLPSLKCNPTQELKNSNSSLSNNRKQRRLQSNPYPSPKDFFSQPSIPSNYCQNSLTNEIKHKTNVYHTITPTSVQNSSTVISPPNTPNELTLPNIFVGSIDISHAIIEHGSIDMDKIPKLVVRHTKTYINKKIDTMGQLFPTWFNEPDYRCIHCFTCDQVFTPQQFMTHVDDEQMVKIQPINMTSIQLLTSEKLSEYKVGLWNDFCTNLANYASKLAELGKQKYTRKAPKVFK